MAQPGQQDDKDAEIEKLKKLLAEKDEKIKTMEEAANSKDDDNNTTMGGTTEGGNNNDENESKMPPKTDVTLSLRGIPEYDQYPYSKKVDRFYFMASVKAPYFRSEQRAPIDLVAVVDESGSMSGDRIKLVKETVQFIIKNLESGDRFGIIGYSSGSRTVLPLTKMDDKGKKKAQSLATNLRASGGTALCAGLVDGVNMMKNRKFKNDVASVMILTDGQANQGPTSASQIIACVRSGKVSGSGGGHIGYGGYGGYGRGPPPMIQNNYNNNMYPSPMQYQQQQQIQGLPNLGMKAKSTKKNKRMQQKPKQQLQGIPPPQPQYQQQMPMQFQQQQMPMYPQQGQQQQGYGQAPMMQQMQGYQAQGQMPQLHSLSSMQGQGQGQTTSTKPVKDMIEDEKEEPGKGKEIKLKDELPCTINTFGFGSGHNASLLEAIAESGRGMYAFIESTDMIADTFAECLGGLVSIIGQDLKIKVEALNNVEITKCLSSGYTMTVTKPKKIHTVSINNLQSEENRDLIFQLKMPAINAKKEKDPIVQLSIQYKNVVLDKNQTLSNVVCINRIEGTQIGERNMELDVQYNRVLAADAMDSADQLANSGKLEEARKVLSSAQDHIKKSKSNKNPFSVNLVNDIQLVQNNMQSNQQYQQQGGKMLKMNKKSHQMQRSVQSSNYQSQSAYCNSSKSMMQQRFQSYK
eukprot:CAMPEP_0201564162 /NCGR_PEP_ID=MMETSP0190_2-20130828/2188_1 /ASSEMBLY_ACC=CAM_ASM_000263 /TAXON_ID=37353 /ORGANISM="Rosalina sp." /LENGTH=688 /DNA_ID=CAMNT_0047979947 /DNA_START=102 /DNA_END=2168 /DNA_ORIENTATION=+